jgi:hypothetical protein
MFFSEVAGQSFYNDYSNHHISFDSCPKHSTTTSTKILMKLVRKTVSWMISVDFVPCSHFRNGVNKESEIQAERRRLQEKIEYRRAIANFACNTPSLSAER